MKKFTLGFFFVLIASLGFSQDLFFSEYCEGGSNNKYIEIFNPTNAAIDLSGYFVKQSNNGSGWGMTGGVEDTRYVLELSGTIEAGGVYIIANASAVQTILDAADTTFAYDQTANNSGGSNVPAFNGDDAMGLFKGETLIDVIGVPTEKLKWDVAGVTTATLDHTILRKLTTTKGNTDWAVSAGTTEEDSEWVVLDKDDYSNIGKHRLVISDLFISEYCEGGSNNKYIELYNPTSASIDLSGYFVKQSNNGSGWGMVGGVVDTRYTLALSGTVEPGDFYIIANAAAVQTILDVADTTFAYDGTPNNIGGANVPSFSGDDAIGLFKADALIDVIGLPDVKEKWTVAGVPFATGDHTLVRKPNTLGGNDDWAMSAGTNEEDSEWIVNAKDYFGDIHFFGIAENDFSSFSFEGAEVAPAVIDNDAATITVEVATTNIDITKLVATFEIPEGATAKIGDVEQVSGTTVNDFTTAVTYTVVSAGGPTKDYVVTVTQIVNPANDIVEMALQAQVEKPTIDATAHTVSAIAKLGTDLSAIEPFFVLSAGATITPTGVQDFAAATNNTITYTVISETQAEQTWDVTVVEEDLPEYTIYEIQYTEDESGDSPKKGEKVVTGGIVTAAIEGKFYIQSGSGAWNGIYVYDKAKLNTAVIGDSVTIVAEVSEYYNLTELVNVESITIEQSDMTIPAAAVVSTLDANEEKYEGVLINIERAEVTTEPNNYGEIEINDGTGVLVVDDELFEYEAPTLNANYSFTGLLTYSFGATKLLPRSADDITDLTSVIENAVKFEMYPNPSNGHLNIEGVEGEFTVQIYNAIGSMVYKSNNSFVNKANLNLDFLNNGIYFVNVVNEGQPKAIRLIINK